MSDDLQDSGAAEDSEQFEREQQLEASVSALPAVGVHEHGQWNDRQRGRGPASRQVTYLHTVDTLCL